MGTPLTYFAVATGAFGSDKARDLEHELRPHCPDGWCEVIVAGVLSKLWARAAGQGEDDGDLGQMSPKRLARVLGWPGDPQVLIDALLGDPDLGGFIEAGEDERGFYYWVCNWAENQPAIQQRIRRRLSKEGAADDGQAPEPPAADRNLQPPTGTSRRRPEPPADPHRKEGRKEERKEDPPPKPPAGGLPLAEVAARSAPKDPPQRKEPRARWFLHAAERAKRLDAVARVVEAYQRHHPRARPGPLERGVIAERLLADGFSVEDLTEAIDGAHVPGCWHAEQGGSALALEVLLRDSAKVEKHRRTLEEHRAGRGRKAGAEAAEAAWVEVQEALPRWRRHEDVELSAGARAGLRAIGGSSRILGADPRAMGALKADFLAGARGVSA